jgi:5-(carboxyamino)imidazole ribonucleotide synthase
LIANEIAPRVHNSGHWSIEGAITSQFANHMRAILGLPLGECTALGQSALINLIGSAPDPAGVLGVPGAYLHLYDKAPRPGRKIGHITVCASDEATLANRVAMVQERIRPTIEPA